MRWLRALVLVAMTACISACGGANGAGASENVDARFATAEALLEHFNELNTAQPRNMGRILPLYHLENEFHRKKWRVLSAMIDERDFELNRMMYEQFGELLDDPPSDTLLPCKAAVLTQVGEQRSEGVYVDNAGVERPLHLIKVDDRWWVSGYTLEYETDTGDRASVEASVDALLELVSQAEDLGSDMLVPVIERLRARQFANADEVREAYSDAIIEAINNMDI